MIIFMRAMRAYEGRGKGEGVEGVEVQKSGDPVRKREGNKGKGGGGGGGRHDRRRRPGENDHWVRDAKYAFYNFLLIRYFLTTRAVFVFV